MTELRNVGLVFLGAGMGGSFRYLIQVYTNRHWPEFPWGTLAINVLGSLLIGVYFGWAARNSTGDVWRFFIPTGLLGGFTTFSAFSAEAIRLWETGLRNESLAYVGASVLLSIAGCMAGLALTRP